ncbi:MAG: hypothetical protein R2688_06765 [Fimbriimonadaceae bacterium]
MSSFCFHDSLERSPQGWFKIADTLWLASEILLERIKNITEIENSAFTTRDILDELQASDQNWQSETIRNNHQIGRLEIYSDLRRVSAMLRAQSIEAELKGVYYTMEIKHKGHVKDVASNYNHGLRKLSENLGIDLTDEELKQLEMLEKMLQFGRYPTAGKVTTKQDTRKSGYYTHSELDRAIRYKIMWYGRPFLKQSEDKGQK